MRDGFVKTLRNVLPVSQPNAEDQDVIMKRKVELSWGQGQQMQHHSSDSLFELRFHDRNVLQRLDSLAQFLTVVACEGLGERANHIAILVLKGGGALAVGLEDGLAVVLLLVESELLPFVGEEIVTHS